MGGLSSFKLLLICLACFESSGHFLAPMLCFRDTLQNQRLRTGNWRPKSFVTTWVRLKTLELTQYNISQTSRRCLMTPSSSSLHTGFLIFIFHAVLEIRISTRIHTTASTMARLCLALSNSLGLHIRMISS